MAVRRTFLKYEARQKVIIVSSGLYSVHPIQEAQIYKKARQTAIKICHTRLNGQHWPLRRILGHIADKTVIKPDKTVIKPDKTVIKPDKTVIKPDKTVIKPSESVSSKKNSSSLRTVSFLGGLFRTSPTLFSALLLY
jgi:hypothetical protein